MGILNRRKKRRPSTIKTAGLTTESGAAAYEEMEGMVVNLGVISALVLSLSIGLNFSVSTEELKTMRRMSRAHWNSRGICDSNVDKERVCR